MTMSSRYPETFGCISGPNRVSINRWNVLGAFINPKGIRVNYQSPDPGTAKAVYFRLAFSKGI